MDSGAGKAGNRYPSELLSGDHDLWIILNARDVVEELTVADGRLHREDFAHWVGTSIFDHLTVESVPKMRAILATVRTGVATRDRELNHTTRSRSEMPVRYAVVPWGDEEKVLMVGQNLQDVAQLQARLVKAQLSLEQEYERMRHVETRYRVLFETTADPLVMIDAESLQIFDANTAAGRLLGRDSRSLAHRNFLAELDIGSRDAVQQGLTGIGANGQIHLQAATQAGKVAIILHATLFRAANDTMILCRLTEESPVTESEETFVAALDAMFQKSADGIVFTDLSGTVIRANRAFLMLADIARGDSVIGRNFAQFLARPGVDMTVMSTNAVENGRLSLYATQLRAAFGREIPVEISTTHLHGGSPGFVFVIRDASRLDTAREISAPVSAESVENIIDLVGSAPLKDLVRSTTDVVEKMCIETAIALTRNNRAAAAEMLGLSRQSLYVKLRKFGLINTVEDDE